MGKDTLEAWKRKQIAVYEAGYEYEQQLPRISNSAEALGSSTALTGDTDGHTSNVPSVVQVVDFVVLDGLSVCFPDV